MDNSPALDAVLDFVAFVFVLVAGTALVLAPFAIAAALAY